MRKRQFRPGLGLVLTGTLLALWLLTGNSQAAYNGSYPYKIGATVGMVGEIAKAVAGDRGEVTFVIGAGVDPHVYNPTRSDVATLLRSDIIFYAGLLLEGQMADVLVKVSRKRPV